MSLLSTIADAAYPLILKGAEEIIDSQLDGATLNEDQKKTLYSAYVVIDVWGDQLVALSTNEYDDEALGMIKSVAADTLEEAGINVPVNPFK